MTNERRVTGYHLAPRINNRNVIMAGTLRALSDPRRFRDRTSQPVGSVNIHTNTIAMTLETTATGNGIGEPVPWLAGWRASGSFRSRSQI